MSYLATTCLSSADGRAVAQSGKCSHLSLKASSDTISAKRPPCKPFLLLQGQVLLERSRSSISLLSCMQGNFSLRPSLRALGFICVSQAEQDQVETPWVLLGRRKCQPAVVFPDSSDSCSDKAYGCCFSWAKD